MTVFLGAFELNQRGRIRGVDSDATVNGQATIGRKARRDRSAIVGDGREAIPSANARTIGGARAAEAADSKPALRDDPDARGIDARGDDATKVADGHFASTAPYACTTHACIVGGTARNPIGTAGAANGRCAAGASETARRGAGCGSVTADAASA